MSDLSVETPEEPPPPHLCRPLQDLCAVIEVEVHLTSHLDLHMQDKRVAMVKWVMCELTAAVCLWESTFLE